ncbi:hypothetical protein [Glaciimonas sp. PCH181]|uniref:hypothetical protein n=1 Tax=Glaciimonas sp. PCH181 TaxID=2133943 RepID=UPI0011B2764F|nr:hypothetical protein [Glaciimonas sp. PCH181]
MLSKSVIASLAVFNINALIKTTAFNITEEDIVNASRIKIEAQNIPPINPIPLRMISYDDMKTNSLQTMSRIN